MPNPGPAAAQNPYIIETGQLAVSLRLRVRLTPKSNRDAVEGTIETEDGIALKVRVRAVPENNAANKALLATIAKWLAIPKTSVTLSTGGKSRIKTLTITTTPADIKRLTSRIDHLQTTQDFLP